MNVQMNENPSITIWVRDNNPDEILLTTFLLRLNRERPDQLPEPIKDMLDKQVSYKRIHFHTVSNMTKGGTNVTCTFER
jgi:hypothetical protein